MWTFYIDIFVLPLIYRYSGCSSVLACDYNQNLFTFLISESVILLTILSPRILFLKAKYWFMQNNYIPFNLSYQDGLQPRFNTVFHMRNNLFLKSNNTIKRTHNHIQSINRNSFVNQILSEGWVSSNWNSIVQICVCNGDIIITSKLVLIKDFLWGFQGTRNSIALGMSHVHP